MAVNSGRIVIVGCGPGSARYVTGAAREAVAQAEVLVGGKRLLDLFADSHAEKIPVDAEVALLVERIRALRAAGRRIAVLVTGDPGLFSLAKTIVHHFGRETCEIVPGVSSVQVAFARLGLDWADAHIESAHGRIPEITAEELGSFDKIAILAGTKEAQQWSARVAGALMDDHVSFLAENLTLDDERFRQVSAERPEGEKGDSPHLPERPATNLRSVPGFAQMGTVPFFPLDAASLSIVLLIRRSLLE